MGSSGPSPLECGLVSLRSGPVSPRLLAGVDVALCRVELWGGAWDCGPSARWPAAPFPWCVTPPFCLSGLFSKTDLGTAVSPARDSLTVPVSLLGDLLVLADASLLACELQGCSGRSPAPHTGEGAKRVPGAEELFRPCARCDAL